MATPWRDRYRSEHNPRNDFGGRQGRMQNNDPDDQHPKFVRAESFDENDINTESGWGIMRREDDLLISNNQYSQGAFTERSEAGIETQRDFSGKGPKGWSRPDEWLKDEVCEALTLDPRIDASEIEVSVQNAIVTLKGSVSDRRTKRYAEGCAEQVRGIVDVRNELSIEEAR